VGINTCDWKKNMEGRELRRKTMERTLKVKKFASSFAIRLQVEVDSNV
jgi:hypothetical protein